MAEMWKPLEAAPKGYTAESGFKHILFRGYSKGRSFAGYAYVSGWMDSDRKPVHNYSYKLVIDAWTELPATGAPDLLKENAQYRKALMMYLSWWDSIPAVGYRLDDNGGDFTKLATLAENVRALLQRGEG